MSDAPPASAMLSGIVSDRPAPVQTTPYRVLARKYRPSSFDDLIGQSAMVRTLSNAFDLNRIHQAYLLCGVRGVGKTTTARIMARALNYHLPASADRPALDAPSIVMPALGTHCQAIIESRHVDVIEMDAASHTGIDDIRELIDGARYRPVMARTKVYIIDEVHMLSKAAFNGLLKTLEEPPEHVKFLFATTEIDKVPITVRSRCQRFDLRRVEAPDMIGHLAGICAKEDVRIDPEALALIARAAEGSVRDALSLLDQAIAHGGGGANGAIDPAAIRVMLGLADRARIIDLFEAVMKGDIATALDGMKALYDEGADPGGMLAALADFVHLVTRLKLVPDAAKDSSLTGEERARGLDFACKLSLPVLTRAWQMLAKGLADVKDAPRPLAAADMVLVRLAYAADLPTPDDVIRRLSAAQAGGVASQTVVASVPAPSGVAPVEPSGGGLRRLGSGGALPQSVPQAALVASPPQASLAPQAAPAPPPVLPQTLQDVVALAIANRDIQLKMALEKDVRIVRFEPGSIEFETVPGASPQLAAHVMRRLNEWTGIRWMVAVAREGGGATLRELADAETASRRKSLEAHPVVSRIMELFPGSRIVDVTDMKPDLPPPEPTVPVMGDDEVGYADAGDPNAGDPDDGYSEDDL
ncbi:DNA polymerase III subunit gamma/tau [Lichenihabitans sp. PAMC28606]|uniref:DNA polymerase III subunit gamma/tau n=1 Tax=Lichenihabitans sp. PAMC28606 TaxID=2880932 RepID=UPI0039B6A5D8